MEDEPEAPDTSTWLMHNQVARRLGRSVSTIRKMREEGQIPAVLESGVYKFDPEVVERLAVEMGVGQGSISEAAAKLAMHAEGTMSGLMTKLIENNQRLFEQMFKLIERAHTYIEKLEDVNHRQREAAESALSQEHDRELARKKAEHLEGIQRQALQALQSQFLPIVMARYNAKRDGAPAPVTPIDPQAEMKAMVGDHVMTMLASLDDAQVAKLKDALPEDQYQMLANLHAMLKPKAA